MVEISSVIGDFYLVKKENHMDLEILPVRLLSYILIARTDLWVLYKPGGDFPAVCPVFLVLGDVCPPNPELFRRVTAPHAGSCLQSGLAAKVRCSIGLIQNY